MKNKLLIATILASSFAVAAEAAPAKTAKHSAAVSSEAREEEKLRAAAAPSNDDAVDDDTYETYRADAEAAPAAGNPNVQKYTPTDGEVNYTDRNIKGYQDPYAANARAYKSNEFGEAAPAPRVNVFSELQEPTYHDDRYIEERIETRTKQYVRPTAKR